MHHATRFNVENIPHTARIRFVDMWEISFYTNLVDVWSRKSPATPDVAGDFVMIKAICNNTSN